MRERVLSAVVLVPVVVVVFLAGMPWLAIGVGVLSVLACLEALRLLTLTGLPGAVLPAIVIPPLAVGAMAWTGAPAWTLSLIVAAAVIATAIEAFRRPDPTDGFRAWVGGSFGAVYASLLAFLVGVVTVAPPLPAGAPLAGWFDAGRTWLLVLVLTVWGFDTFAYLSGRTFKRGRFLNHISPNKTWSGVIGGTVAAALIGGALVWGTGGSPLGGALLGLAIAVTAQAGDVAESLLKRAGGQKDSGSLIPGHDPRWSPSWSCPRRPRSWAERWTPTARSAWRCWARRAPSGVRRSTCSRARAPRSASSRCPPGAMRPRSLPRSPPCARTS
jgi:phosphatidate cytidylyltransferase